MKIKGITRRAICVNIGLSGQVRKVGGDAHDTRIRRTRKTSLIDVENANPDTNNHRR